MEIIELVIIKHYRHPIFDPTLKHQMVSLSQPIRRWV